MIFGLSHKTIEAINSVFAAHSLVQKVLIFGSRAKGNYKEGSDIDLAIFPEIPSKELDRIWLEIDELNLPYMVDLVINSPKLSADLSEHIERVGKVFYES